LHNFWIFIIIIPFFLFFFLNKKHFYHSIQSLYRLILIKVSLNFLFILNFLFLTVFLNFDLSFKKFISWLFPSEHLSWFQVFSLKYFLDWCKVIEKKIILIIWISLNFWSKDFAFVEFEEFNLLKKLFIRTLQLRIQLSI